MQKNSFLNFFLNNDFKEWETLKCAVNRLFRICKKCWIKFHLNILYSSVLKETKLPAHKMSDSTYWLKLAKLNQGTLGTALAPIDSIEKKQPVLFVGILTGICENNELIFLNCYGTYLWLAILRFLVCF